MAVTNQQAVVCRLNLVTGNPEYLQVGVGWVTTPLTATLFTTWQSAIDTASLQSQAGATWVPAQCLNNWQQR